MSVFAKAVLVLSPTPCVITRPRTSLRIVLNAYCHVLFIEDVEWKEKDWYYVYKLCSDLFVQQREDSF